MHVGQLWSAVRKRPVCILIPLFETNLLKWLSDEWYLKLEYRVLTAKKLHLNPPVTFNEKIQWLKLHDRKPIYRELADKLRNREFLKDNGAEQYMVPLLGIWERAEDIDFDILPDKFVLKCTQGYGGMIICHDKEKLDIEKVRKSLAKTLATDFFPRGREWAYGRNKPCIIAEELIDDGGGERPADYKFLCMNGEVKLVCVSRSLGEEDRGCVSFFRPDGERVPFRRVDYPEYPGNNPMPHCFDEMKKVAERLAKAADASFIRVDFYERNEKAYFSEFTFYPCGGTMFLDPPEYDEVLGKMLDIGVWVYGTSQYYCSSI